MTFLEKLADLKFNINLFMTFFILKKYESYDIRNDVWFYLHLKVFYFVTCVTFCICCILNMALTRQSVIPTYILSGEPISGEED